MSVSCLSPLRRRRLLAAAALSLPALPTLATPAPVRPSGRQWRLNVPAPPYFDPTDQPFNRALLSLALERMGDAVMITRSSAQTWARQVRELDSGQADVAPLPALPRAYEGFRLRRVDFPLRPGLLGLRLLLVRADRLREFAGINTLAGLRRLRLGYGLDWVDRAEMQRQGFQLVGARSATALYQLLREGQCDMLSRGINELDQELKALAANGPPLAVLPGVALHYPLEDCYFLAPQHQELQQRLLAGLQRLLADGGWLRLLGEHYAARLRGLGFEDRRVIRLPDYPAPEGLPPELLDAPRWLPKILQAGA